MYFYYTLFLSKGLYGEILEHEIMRYVAVDKIFDLISGKYWPGLYEEMTFYVNSCVTLQAMSRKDKTVLFMDSDWFGLMAYQSLLVI